MSMDFLCNADVYCSEIDESGEIVLVDKEKQQISVKFFGNEQIKKFAYPLTFKKRYLKALDDTISSRIAEDIQKAEEEEKKKAAEEKQRQETEIANKKEKKRAKREKLGNKPAEYYNIKNYTELLLKEHDQRLAGFKYKEENSANNRFLMLFKDKKYYWENMPVTIHMEIHDNKDVHNVFLHMEVINTATGDFVKDGDLKNYLGDKYKDYVEFRENVRNVFSNISRGRRLGGLTVAMLYINGETCEEFLNSFLQKAEEVDELFGKIK